MPREIHHLSHMSNLIPGRQQLNLKFSLMFKGLLPDKIFLLKSCIDFSLLLVLKEEGEKMKRRLSSFGGQTISHFGSTISHFGSTKSKELSPKIATFSAIAWAPDSFNVWQRVISLCRSLSLLFARDFELRFTYSLYACKGTVWLDFMGS